MENETEGTIIIERPMTPEEKAKDLFDKYWNVDSDIDSAAYTDKNMAIKCALIAVDEILDDDMYDMSEDLFEKRILYWEEVKQEIQNL